MRPSRGTADRARASRRRAPLASTVRAGCWLRLARHCAPVRLYALPDPCDSPDDGVCDVPRYCVAGDYADCGTSPTRSPATRSPASVGLGCAVAVALPVASAPTSAVQCSGTVEVTLTSSGVSISDGPGQYSNSQSCTWVITGAGRITVQFTEFSTEAGYDYVKLYDGASTSSTSLGSFSGTTVPAPVTSTSGSLTVTFTSDSSSVNNGFVANLVPAVTLPPMPPPPKLAGAVPPAIGELRCFERIQRMCGPIRPALRLLAAVGTAVAVQGPERAAPERVAPRQPVAAHGAHIDVRPHIRKASTATVASLARARGAACSKLSKNAFEGPFPPVLLKMTWLQELCALAASASEPAR